MRLLDCLLLFCTGFTDGWLNVSQTLLDYKRRSRKLFEDQDYYSHYRNRHVNSDNLTSFQHALVPHPVLRSKRSSVCSKDDSASHRICDSSAGKVCVDSQCVSACQHRNMNRCTCPEDSDDYCFLCCGNSRHQCAPAHTYDIFKPNGELWERPECAWCRKGGQNRVGLHCDDFDRKKVCFNDKCNGVLCAAAPEGKYCIQERSTNRICAQGHCLDPCEEKQLHICECSIASIYRCELCCMDQSGKCQSARENFRIQKDDGRPYPRSGLSCGRYDYTCNKYAQCFSPPRFHLPSLTISMCLILCLLTSIS